MGGNVGQPVGGIILTPHSTILRDALISVIAERQRQKTKWGQQDHDPDHFVAILVEEVGELAKAALEARKGASPEKMRTEAVHVAAFAVAIIESLDRDEWKWWSQPFLVIDDDPSESR